MNVITCRQLGGPCDVELYGETADEIIKAQDRHLREATRRGQSDHEPARAAMKGHRRDRRAARDRPRDTTMAS